MFTLIQDYSPPGADQISHAAEACTWTFDLGPDQTPGQAAIRDGLIQASIDKLAEQGSQLLRLRVWEDATPTFVTHYKVEVTATASPLLWGLIIAGVLLVLALAFITWAIIEVKKLFWGPNGAGGISGDIKQTAMYLAIGIGIIGLVVVIKRR